MGATHIQDKWGISNWSQSTNRALSQAVVRVSVVTGTITIVHVDVVNDLAPFYWEF